MSIDGVDASLERARSAWKRAVADLKLDDILALGLQPSRHGEDIKGRFRGQTLSDSAQFQGSGSHALFNRKNVCARKRRGLLLVRDRLRQRADHGR